MADKTTLLSICDAVHVVLIKCDAAGEKTLVSSHHLEWRPLLAAPGSRCSLGLQMMGVGQIRSRLRRCLEQFFESTFVIFTVGTVI